MKKSIIFLLCILFVIAIIGSGLGGYYLSSNKEKEEVININQESGDLVFDKPEDCILYLFEELKKGDIDKMVSAFSTSITGANFDFETYSKRMNIIHFGSLGMLPTNHEFFQEINQLEVKGRAISYIKGFIISLLLNRDIEEYPLFQIDSTDEIAEIEGGFDFSRIEDIEVLEICKIQLNNEQAKENNTKIANQYGHERLDEYMVSFEFEKEKYAVGFTLFEDNKKFSIYGLYASMMGTSTVGFAEPMDVDKLTDLVPDDSGIYSADIIYKK